MMLTTPRVNLISEPASDRELVNQDRIMVENLTATPHISSKGCDKMVELAAIIIKEMTMEMKKMKMIFTERMRTTQRNSLIKTVKQDEHVVQAT